LDCASSYHQQPQRLQEETKQNSPQLPVLGLGPVFTIKNRCLSKKGKAKENIDLPSFEKPNPAPNEPQHPKEETEEKMGQQAVLIPAIAFTFENGRVQGERDTPRQQRENHNESNCSPSLKKRKTKVLSLDCALSEPQNPKEETKQKIPQSADLSPGTVFNFETGHVLEKKPVTLDRLEVKDKQQPPSSPKLLLPIIVILG